MRGLGLLYVCGKLPNNPSLKPTLTLSSHLGQKVGLGDGSVSSFPEMYYDPFFLKLHISFPLVRNSLFPPHEQEAVAIFYHFYFYCNTQREPLRRGARNSH